MILQAVYLKATLSNELLIGHTQSKLNCSMSLTHLVDFKDVQKQEYKITQQFL